jgi:uncharacterized membrane protein
MVRGELWLSGFKGMVLAAVVLSVWLRFAHLEQKPYWLDEAFTSLHISGYTIAEVEHQIAQGQILDRAALQRYQFPTPETQLWDTVRCVVLSAPELPPLYFGLARLWQEQFGHSIAVIRSLSAVLSLLSFPCMYWLCLELLQSPFSGWVAIALLATSPLHLLYAQEARPYSLWITLILLSHSTFLRAVRLQTRRSWVIYTVSLILGLYTQLLFVSIPLGHGLYLGWTERHRWRQSPVKSYLRASLAGFALFVPWLVWGLAQAQASPSDYGADEPLDGAYWYAFVKGWVRSLSLIFIDFSLDEQSSWLALGLFLVGVLAFLILMGYAALFLWQRAPRSVSLFIVSMVAIQILVLLGLDMVGGELRSIRARYWLPAYLGIQLGVAYLFAGKMTTLTARQPRIRWRVAFTVVLTIGLASCLTFSQSTMWWHKSDTYLKMQVAQRINQAQQPLVISDTFLVKLLSLSHLLEDHVQFLVISNATVPEIPQQGSTFLYQPSALLRKRFAGSHTLIPLEDSLWSVQKRGNGQRPP